MTSYRDYVSGVLAPPWLMNPKGAALTGALGGQLDDVLLRLKDGIKAKLASLAPRDGLSAVAFERGLPRNAGESDAGWAARLVAAWDAWYLAGTPTGLLSALYGAGYAPKLVIAQGLEYELDLSTGLVMTENDWGGPFDFTGLGTSFWSAFVLYFPTARWPAAWTTAGHPPLVTSDEAQTMMQLARRWMPAYASFVRVVFGDSAIWGFPPVWGTSRIWGGSSYWSWTPPTV